MRWIHPNASQAAVLAALAAVLGVAGCRTPSGSVANPFLAPARVPPPATRAILPGQAQPYYPGDPLPVMQSNGERHIDGAGLAWSATGESAPATRQSAATRTQALANEAVVAIPRDDDSLRFGLSATAEPGPASPHEPSPIEVAAEARGEGVLQASYTEPILERSEPVASPWRPPQISQPPLPPPPPVVQLFVPQPASLVAAPPNDMSVRLRAVASPLPEPGEVPTPRIRLPGNEVAETASYDGFRPRSSMR